MPHLAGLGPLLLSAALSPSEIRARAEAVLAAGKYQTELPAPRPPPSFDLPVGPIQLLLKILFWTAVVVIAVLVVSWLWRRLSGGARDAEVAAPAAEAPAEIPIESAEALAAQGRWAEAIHALLLETLEALSRAAKLAPSLTSREIVERISLPSRARGALEGLVLAVEISRFGGEPAAEGDYRACLSSFHAFLDTYRSAA